MTKRYTLREKRDSKWVITTYGHESQEAALADVHIDGCIWAKCYEVTGYNFWGDEKLKLVWEWKRK